MQIHVLHFQDTNLFVRFDAPLAEARAFANGLVEEGIKPGDDLWYGDPPKLSWWPRRWPAGFEGGEDTVVKEDGRPAVKLVLVPKGDSATIWLETFGD